MYNDICKIVFFFIFFIYLIDCALVIEVQIKGLFFFKKVDPHSRNKNCCVTKSSKKSISLHYISGYINIVLLLKIIIQINKNRGVPQGDYKILIKSKYFAYI